jgi:transposase InsO family protein
VSLPAGTGRPYRPVHSAGESSTDSRHDLPVAPNLLDRNFTAERPDTVWLADISYLPTDEGWLSLAAINDMATREIVGWSMAGHLQAGLCVDALVMALQRCRPPEGLVHHSDSKYLPASVAGRPDPHSDGPVSVVGAARRLVAV